MKSNCEFSEDTIEKFIRDITDIWSNTKFDISSNQTINLLNGLIEIIHESALEDDRIMRQIHAKLCNKISGTYYRTTTDDHKKDTFVGDILMERWKKELNIEFNNYKKEVNRDSLLKEYQDDLDKRFSISIEPKIAKAKKRFFNNILFIGECYAYCFKNWLKPLPMNDELMDNCIEKLIMNEPQEDYLECLCDFMMTIGEKYDTPQNTSKMEFLFNKLNEIRRREFVSLKMRSKMMDLFKLRANKWSRFSRPKIESYEKKLNEIMVENLNKKNNAILTKIEVYLNLI